MQRSRIEWCKYTWNPVTGCSIPETCAVREHCYARRRAYMLRGRFGYPLIDPFGLAYHPGQMEEPYKIRKPSTIFVCSMGDLFGSHVGDARIKPVLNVAWELRQHRFIFLTKNPDRYKLFREDFTDNSWIGTTINTVKDLKRLDALLDSVRNPDVVRFVSFEPLYESMKDLREYDLSKLNWIIIGAQTRPQKQPEHHWVMELMEIAGMFDIPVFMKNNLNYDLKLQEFPYYWSEKEKEWVHSITAREVQEIKAKVREE